MEFSSESKQSIFTMQRYIITVALVCALQLITLGSSSPVVDNTGPMLNVISATPDEIEGEYYSDLAEGNSIYFRSRVYEDDSYFIQITTTDGDPILTIKGSHGSNSVTIVYILGTKIVITNYTNGNIFSESHYYVPADYQQAVEKAFVSNQNSLEVLTKLLHYLDQERTISKVELSSLTALLQRPEIELIRAAAQAVENSGTEGSETIAAMNFYDMSLQLKIAKVKLLKKYEQLHNSQQNNRLTKRWPDTSSGGGDTYDDDESGGDDHKDCYDVDVCIGIRIEIMCNH